ncbi:SIS domain-containing protein [Leifsonia sp. LS-T14]|uniref:SIS domain-containing protein n=1 Tax=unclassified Leifsonia TaxID=2663824 RepID=UPI0035A725AD
MDLAQRFSHIPSTLDEIAARPLSPQVAALAEGVSRVRIAAMGGSYNASLAAVERFLERGIDARAELASHVVHSSAATIADDELVILISYSGTSVETIRAAQALKDRGVRTLCITNAPDSELAGLCDATVDQGLTEVTHTPFGPWTATYLTLFRVAAAAAGEDGLPSAELGAAAAAALAAADGILALQPTAPAYAEFFGRGALAATAVQATLIVREIARVPAAAWDSSTYRHGPIEGISSEQLSLVFAAREGRAAELDASFARALRDITGRVVVVGPDDASVAIPVADEYLPLVSLIVPSVLAYAWGEQAGIPAGEFRYTSHSITDEAELTREN